MELKNSQNKPKILVVTPRFPYPESGACEQDRADSIRQLQRLGFEVRVIGKVFSWQDKDKIVNSWISEGVHVEVVEYKYQRTSLFRKLGILLKNPMQLDGSTLEYVEPEIASKISSELEMHKPDLVWFDYTYLWPLYKIVQKKKIPIVTRSINFEARHFLEEDGKNLLNFIKYIPKWLTEKIVSKKSDLLLSITPLEKEMYNKIGAKNVLNMPLRSLANKLDTHEPKDVEKLHVFFSGSTYNVSHNRKALEFIVRDLAPIAFEKFKDKFTFHITGSKFPKNLRVYVKDNVVFEGFVDDMDLFLQNMDIAVVPSMYGAGMQQKIFEPLSRGFPTITHERGLAGYDFAPEKDVLVGDTGEEFMGQLEKLQNLDIRKSLSKNAIQKSDEQFSQVVIDEALSKALQNLVV